VVWLGSSRKRKKYLNPTTKKREKMAQRGRLLEKFRHLDQKKALLAQVHVKS